MAEVKYIKDPEDPNDILVCVTGLCPWELLAALHNHSRVLSPLVCRLQGRRGDITAEEAKEEAQLNVRDEYQMSWDGVPFWPGYLFGRPIKAQLRRFGEEIVLRNVWAYDRDAGDGAWRKAIEGLIPR
jgi:hypothetical protein